MNVLFYIPVTGEAGERIHRVAEMAAPKARTEVFRSIKDLSWRLCRPAESPSIAVLLAGDEEDLLSIVSIRHLLSEIPVILILPVSDHRITAMGHRLSPRFLTYMDGNFAEVEAVLGKMLENYEKEDVMEEWYNIWQS
jgi:hypothetical protein